MSPVPQELTEPEDELALEGEIQHEATEAGSSPRNASRPTGTSTSACDCAEDGLASRERDNTSLKANTNEVLMSKITAFDSQRGEEKIRMYRAIFWVVTRMFVVGTVISGAGLALHLVLPEHVVLGEGVRILGLFLIVLGLLMGSSCPLDLLDFNVMVKQNWKSMTTVFVVIFLVALSQVKLFPHVDLFKALVAVGGAISTWPWAPAWWPYFTSWMVFYFVTLAVGGGAFWLFPERNDLPKMVTWGYYLNSGERFAYGIVIITKWLRWRWLLWQQTLAGGKGQKLNSHTGESCLAMYGWCIGEGLGFVLQGLFPALQLQSGSREAVVGLMNIIKGASRLLPGIVVLAVARERIFDFLGRHFDRDVARLRRDGAFIAELLDGIPVQVGQLWWVHREQPDERYEMQDPRRLWQHGRVVKVHEEDSHEFEVQLALQESNPLALQESNPRKSRLSMHSNHPKLPDQINMSELAVGPALRFPLPSKGGAKSREDLLLQAQRGLRCIDFNRLTQELMYRVDSRNRPDLQAEWYGLSRPVRDGEKIDYFMSNSWYDDPVRKWEKLKEVAERFQKRHGRSPTLWLDKVCIDQTAITDGLKVLPVNVMACRKLLCLCGDTYLSRLWCIWELFTLFAFVSEESATQRVEFVSLGTFQEGLDMLDSMAFFHVKDAHCYDPNEEARLRQVIDAVGTIRFNERISRLAQVTRARYKQRVSAIGVVGRSISATSVGRTWSSGKVSTTSKASATSEEVALEEGMPTVRRNAKKQFTGKEALAISGESDLEDGMHAV